MMSIITFISFTGCLTQTTVNSHINKSILNSRQINTGSHIIPSNSPKRRNSVHTSPSILTSISKRQVLNALVTRIQARKVTNNCGHSIKTSRNIKSSRSLAVIRRHRIRINMATLTPVDVTTPIHVRQTFRMRALPHHTRRHLRRFNATLQINRQHNIRFRLRVALNNLRVGGTIRVVQRMSLTERRGHRFLTHHVVSGQLNSQLIFNRR